MSLFDSGIRPAIDEYLARRTAEKRDYGLYWSASSAGYCMRLNILKRLNIPCVPEIAEDEARTTRIFECGHIFHEWMQRITKDAGLSIAQELELQDEDLMIRGHFDDLVLIKPSKETIEAFRMYESLNSTTLEEDIKARKDAQHLILYDYKTANSQSFNYKQDEMGHYHKMQLGTYMYMLRQRELVLDSPKEKYEFSRDSLTEGRILTISKDDLRMREQQLMWSPDLEKQVVEYWRTLQGYWDKKALPTCTCHLHDGGFMGKRSKKGKVYNPYFLHYVPCSEEWIKDKMPEGWQL